MHSLVKIENRKYPGRYSFIILLDMKTIGLIFGSFSSWTKVVLQFIFVCKEFLYLLMGFLQIEKKIYTSTHSTQCPIFKTLSMWGLPHLGFLDPWSDHSKLSAHVRTLRYEDSSHRHILYQTSLTPITCTAIILWNYCTTRKPWKIKSLKGFKRVTIVQSSLSQMLWRMVISNILYTKAVL